LIVDIGVSATQSRTQACPSRVYEANNRNALIARKGLVDLYAVMFNPIRLTVIECDEGHWESSINQAAGKKN
jgi:hypothetical protein